MLGARSGWAGWRDRLGPLLIIVGGLAARAAVAWPGYLSSDDLTLSERALASPLSLHYLFTPWNNHVMPGGFGLYWIIVRLAGLAYWPYVLVFLAGQAVAAVIFFRLMRRWCGPGWASLLPLAMLQLTPITLSITTDVSTAVEFVPVEIATGWALSAQERYLATRRARHLVSLGAALVFGLGFFEKSLLIGPLVVLVTVGLLAPPAGRRWLRGLGSTLRDTWRSWVVLGGVSVVYLVGYLYLTRSGTSLRAPTSGQEVGRFFADYLGRVLVPGLVGGPLRWSGGGAGPSNVDPPIAVEVVSLVLVAAIIVATTRRRPAAGRAWLVLAVYTALAAGLIAATRLGEPLAPIYGLMPRFGSDVVVVAALCLGAAIAGPPTAGPRPGTAARTGVVAALAITMLATTMLAATTVSDVTLARAWSVNYGRDFLRTAQAQLTAMPPDTLYFDRFVSAAIIWPLLPAEEKWQSRLLATANGPRLPVVTEGEVVFVLDDSGHVRPIALDGVDAAQPGLGPGPCAWLVTGPAPVTIPLGSAVTLATPAARIDYVSATDTTATLTIGATSVTFPVRAGEHHEYLALDPGTYGLLRADQATVSGLGSAGSLCIEGLRVGEVIAEPASGPVG